MPAEHDELEAAMSELTRSMARFVRALDAVDESVAASHLSADFAESIDRLASRLDGIEGLGG